MTPSLCELPLWPSLKVKPPFREGYSPAFKVTICDLERRATAKSVFGMIADNQFRETWKRDSG